MSPEVAVRGPHSTRGTLGLSRLIGKRPLWTSCAHLQLCAVHVDCMLAHGASICALYGAFVSIIPSKIAIAALSRSAHGTVAIACSGVCHCKLSSWAFHTVRLSITVRREGHKSGVALLAMCASHRARVAPPLTAGAGGATLTHRVLPKAALGAATQACASCLPSIPTSWTASAPCL